MKIDRIRIAEIIDRLASSFGIGAIILAVFILLLRIIIHFPFFDESLHVHYLWLLSNGYTPGVDFYCHYPVLSYLFMVPFFKLLPDSAFVVLVLRYVSLIIYIGIGLLLYFHGRKVTGDWGTAIIPLILLASSSNIGPYMIEFSVDPFATVTAVGAMLIFFRTPSERTIATSAGLSLLSVLLTPKYIFPLFFGLIGHAAAYILASRKKIKTIMAISIGGAAALAFVLTIYWLNEVSLTGNLAATLTTSRTIQKMNEIMPYTFLLARLVNKPVYVVMIVLGLLGWAVRSRRRIDQITLSGAGILLGLILFFFTISLPLEQYLMAFYVSLAMFAPFAFAAWKDTLGVKILRSAMFVVVFIVAVNQYPALLQEFMGTSVYVRDASNSSTLKGPPAVQALANIDKILRVIPKEERVVALWPYHPMLRKDLTGITWDERPSYTEALSDNDPNAVFFDPKSYRAALDNHIPALIDVNKLQTNYPPGWYELTVDFMDRNNASYVRVPSSVQPGEFYYIRRDLMPLQ
ncbi:MAG: hypothetical protein HZC48_02325 [Nitrospirae bacterium]|nr:hypothetical protein [Nitrospirota bacterium]